MKNLKFITLCLVSMIILGSTSCKTNSDPTKEISMKLDFFCEHGKTNIEKEIAKENGVIYVRAHLKKQSVTIKYDTTKVTKDKLVAALEKIGFKTEFSKPDANIVRSCPDKEKE